MIARPPKRPRMDVRVVEPAAFKVHQAFVRSRGCCVLGCRCVPVQFHHLRTAANASKSARPHDGFGVGLCHAHHHEEHSRGAETFGRQYHIDVWLIAARLVSQSPDAKMRESFDRLPAHLQGLLYPERLAA
jgi:hypothetical protein